MEDDNICYRNMKFVDSPMPIESGVCKTRNGKRNPEFPENFRNLILPNRSMVIQEVIIMG